MKLPKGKISGDEINKVFTESIEYHTTILYDFLKEYEPTELFKNWKECIKSIDEIINIPLEMRNNEEIERFLTHSFDYYKKENQFILHENMQSLTKNFDKKVAQRFKLLSTSCFAIDNSYLMQGIFKTGGSELRLNSTENAIDYLQSRRLYYLTTLNLIPKVAKGNKQTTLKYTFNDLHYTVESCSLAITNAHYNLLLNYCLDDFELNSDGVSAKPNFIYSHLEENFLEPQRMSLLDQLEFRSKQIGEIETYSTPKNRIFSFIEVRNTMIKFKEIFKKYNLSESLEYQKIELFCNDVSHHIKNDYDVIIDEKKFKKIMTKYSELDLYNISDDYFTILNSYSPFQKNKNKYYSTVVLLVRFINHTLSKVLAQNKSFQINSGFVFEDKVSTILEKHGFNLTYITRINRKEFDIITTKNDKIYNFQCKNIFSHIAKVNGDFKEIGRSNKTLCSSFERALIKEEGREQLILDKVGLNDIEHFVVSRFPVITRNPKIINFNNIEKAISVL